MKVAVMGYGHYGRALGSLLEHNGVEFTPVDVDLPLKHEVEILIQVVPTQSIRQAFETNAKFFNPDMVVINAAKGIEQSSHELPHQIIEELGYKNYYCLMGPSFATEIIDQQPTLVSLGYANDKQAKVVVEMLQTSYFRVQGSADYQSLELAAAMKNVYAILCGYAEGLGFKGNTRAKLITLALQEVVKLAAAMGQSVDVLAAGVVGDLVLTCSSTESRNFRFGQNLATMTQQEAFDAVGSTVEGFHTSQSIQALAKEHKAELPLATLTQRIIDKGAEGHRHFQDYVQSI